MLFCATCIKDITGYYRISNEIVFFSRGTEGELTKAEGLSNPMASREIWDKFPESIYKMNKFHFVN